MCLHTRAYTNQSIAIYLWILRMLSMVEEQTRVLTIAQHVKLQLK